MTLRLHNTLSRTKEDFIPLDPKNVRMYVCGPTVYDYAHIGNARPAIVFDVLFRLLKHLAAKGEWDGGKGETKVTYVRNITDIDDKINARAAELQKSENKPILDIVRELTVETTKIYEADMAALGCLPPTHSPRATQHIPQMIQMIEALIAADHAYPAEGHVLFDVSSKADYGKLAGRSVDDMIAGARVDPAPYKKSPMDFVLWKPSDEHTPGWESPWGFGRPGWHLECSAMSDKYLWEDVKGQLSPEGLKHEHEFDIHGGGIDLVFPHHENEVAQSEGAHHEHPLARYWLHNGHLQVEGAKMSKSLGNFVTVHDLLKQEHPEVLRLQMLMTHYRQPIDWTERGRRQARAILNHWYHSVDGFYPSEKPPERILDALKDDLNTPEAIMLMTQSLDPMALGAAANFLGLLQSNLDAWRRWRPAGEQLDEEEIARAIEVRNAARKAKDFAESDRIRDELLAKGIVLKDGKDDTTWEVKR